MKTNTRTHNPLLFAFALLLALTAVFMLSACDSKSINGRGTTGPSATASTVPTSTPSGAGETLEPNDTVRGDEDNADADGDEDVPKWDGFDFGQNIEYAEEYEIVGDPGDNLRPWEAAKALADGTLIELYGMEFPIRITLVGLEQIEGEECYIFEVSTQFAEERHQSRYGVGYLGAVYSLVEDHIVSGDGRGDLPQSDPNDAGNPAWQGAYMGDGYAIEITDFDGSSFSFDLIFSRNGKTMIAGIAALSPENSRMAKFTELSFLLSEDFSAIDVLVSKGSEWSHLSGSYKRLEP